MLFHIIAKAVIGIPTLIEAPSVDEALDQVNLRNLDTSRAFILALSPAQEWIIEEDTVYSALFHVTDALKSMLDLLKGANVNIYDEPAIIASLAALQEAELAKTIHDTTRREVDERGRTGSNTA